MQDLIEIMDILSCTESDHSILKFKIAPINERTGGPSSWQFNNSSVHDPNFVEPMKSKIPSFYQESSELADARRHWEHMI